MSTEGGGAGRAQGFRRLRWQLLSLRQLLTLGGRGGDASRNLGWADYDEARRPGLTQDTLQNPQPAVEPGKPLLV